VSFRISATSRINEGGKTEPGRMSRELEHKHTLAAAGPTPPTPAQLTLHCAHWVACHSLVVGGCCWHDLAGQCLAQLAGRATPAETVPTALGGTTGASVCAACSFK
jgi:hypothetical protein